MTPFFLTHQPKTPLKNCQFCGGVNPHCFLRKFLPPHTEQRKRPMAGPVWYSPSNWSRWISSVVFFRRSPREKFVEVQTGKGGKDCKWACFWGWEYDVCVVYMFLKRKNANQTFIYLCFMYIFMRCKGMGMDTLSLIEPGINIWDIFGAPTQPLVTSHYLLNFVYIDTKHI